MKQPTRISAILLAAVATSACATLFNDSKRSVGMTSNPTGAEIYIDGTLRGTTPISLDLNNHTQVTVVFRKQGYQDISCTIGTSVGAGWIILDVLGGLLPIIVDAATGAWYSLESSNCNVVLPVEGAPTGIMSEAQLREYTNGDRLKDALGLSLLFASVVTVIAK